MPEYRRYQIADRPRFITLVTAGRVPGLVKHWSALRQAFRIVRTNQPFYLDALVILPDHCHLISTLPSGEIECASRINQIKGAFARAVPDFAPVNASHRRRGKPESGRGATGSVS